MPRIFEREEIQRMLPLVCDILRDLKATLRELHLTLRRKEQGDREAEHLFRLQRQDLRRHVNDLEQLGCCVRNPGEVEVLFPAIRGAEMGFYHLRPGAQSVGSWRPARIPATQRGRSPKARAFPG
jgi:hypothetical protein